jgi:hypothetical protein
VRPTRHSMVVPRINRVHHIPTSGQTSARKLHGLDLSIIENPLRRSGFSHSLYATFRVMQRSHTSLK